MTDVAEFERLNAPANYLNLLLGLVGGALVVLSQMLFELIDSGMVSGVYDFSFSNTLFFLFIVILAFTSIFIIGQRNRVSHSKLVLETELLISEAESDLAELKRNNPAYEKDFQQVLDKVSEVIKQHSLKSELTELNDDEKIAEIDVSIKS